MLHEVTRVARVLFWSRGRPVIAFDRPHPVYTVMFEEHPPEGFVFFRDTTWRYLKPFDQLARRRVKLIHHDASVQSDFWRDIPSIVSCEGRPRAEFFSNELINRVLVHSRWAGAELLEQKRVTLLRLTVPLQPPVDRRRRNGEPLVLLAVGIGGMVKGLDVVARVFGILRKEMPVRLVIGGVLGHDFNSYPEITAEAYGRANFPALDRSLRDDPDVIFRQFPRQVVLNTLYPAADIYLHLVRMDTYPLSVLEAMSYGLPIVATKWNAIPEMVHHGENGFLIDALGLDINTPEWADKVEQLAVEETRRLLTDDLLRERMGAASRARLHHAFDIDYARSALTTMYASTLQKYASI